jgi:alkylhydroperoxidase family enzyme
MTPRIPPLRPDELDDRQRALVGDLPGGHLGIVATFLRHPALFGPFAAFGGALTLHGRLDARSRELATLRTAVHVRSDYEWGQHAVAAVAAGTLDDGDVARVLDGARARGWSSRDAAVLDAADELHADSRVSDATWARLIEHFDVEQLIELTMLVGLYHLVAFTGSSLGVENEPGEPPLPR